MRILGLIGGMSWESTVPYYRVVNETVRDLLGGLHSARLVLYSVDFDEVEQLQMAGRWDEAGEVMANAARALEAAGAGMIVLCTNTMHRVAPQIEAAVDIPMLHIADPTAQAIRAAGLTRVGLLGTRFTMEQPFYAHRLREMHGIETITPHAADRAFVHETIYTQLCCGILSEESRARFRDIIAGLVEQGAQGVILGCTEIGLLVGPGDATVPLFDTGELHARAAGTWVAS